MDREKISLTSEELSCAVVGDLDGYKLVDHKITGEWRHGTEETSIVQRISDGKYFALHFRNSVKETCEWNDMNYDGQYTEVFPYEKTVIEYK